MSRFSSSLEKIIRAGVAFRRSVLEGAWDRRTTTGRLIMGLASAGFLVGLIAAWRALPEGVRFHRYEYLAILALVLVPATVFLNAARYDNSARILGQRVGLSQAWRISILASAANLLPLPGAALVRIAGLKSLGQSVGAAAASTGVVAGVWASVTGLVSGIWQLRAGSRELGVLFVLGGVAAGVVSLVLMSRAKPRGSRLAIACRLIVVEVMVVFVAAMRIYLVSLAIGASASFSQAIALIVAGVLASAVGMLPGGLGLREALSATIAVGVGLPASVGFVVAAVDRLTGIVVLFPLSLMLLPGTRQRDAGRSIDPAER